MSRLTEGCAFERHKFQNHVVGRISDLENLAVITVCEWRQASHRAECAESYFLGNFTGFRDNERDYSGSHSV
jgi:hypothetical protein